MHNVAITYSVLLILQNSYDIQHSQSEEIETYLFLTYGYYFYINELSFPSTDKNAGARELTMQELTKHFT